MTDSNSTPPLKAVSRNLPEPPYPADTGVKGWRFQLDHERLFASDTWALAPAEMRPWLLMIWHTCWTQRPAGSFTNDRAVIAAKIGMDPRLFAAHADILLRGFVLHSDGRLYHPVVVEQVLGLLGVKEAERQRKAEYRRKQAEERGSPTNVPRDRRGTDAGIRTPEPEPEPEPEKKEKNPPTPQRGKWVLPAFVNAKAWAEFEQHRRDIKKPLTDLARTKAANQLKGLSPAEQQACIDKSIQARWPGLFPERTNAKSKQSGASSTAQRGEQFGNEVWSRINGRSGDDR